MNNPLLKYKGYTGSSPVRGRFPDIPSFEWRLFYYRFTKKRTSIAAGPLWYTFFEKEF